MKKIKFLISLIFAVIIFAERSSYAMFSSAASKIDVFDYLACMVDEGKNNNDAKTTIKAISANINLVDSNKRTVLMYACAVGFYEMVDNLIFCGANVKSKDSAGNNALMYAKVMGHENIVALLKRRGVENLNIGNEQADVLKQDIQNWCEKISKLSSEYATVPNPVVSPLILPIPKLPIQEYEKIEKFDNIDVDNVMKPLNELIGLEKCKNQIAEFVNTAQQIKLDKKIGIKRQPQVLHMMLTGNPGTGKTTIAKMLAKIYYEAGLIKQNKLVVVEKADLVGQYIGWTEMKVKDVLNRAEGGILFIDEAYALVGKGEKDFGREVVDGLLTALTTDNCVIIVAGYQDKMQEFLRSNDGLERRFGIKIHLDDYTAEELYRIFEKKCADIGLSLHTGAREKLIKVFELAKKNAHFGNAGFVDNLFQSIMRRRDIYVSKLNQEQQNERRIIREEYVVEGAKTIGYIIT